MIHRDEIWELAVFDLIWHAHVCIKKYQVFTCIIAMDHVTSFSGVMLAKPKEIMVFKVTFYNLLFFRLGEFVIILFPTKMPIIAHILANQWQKSHAKSHSENWIKLYILIYIKYR